MRGHEGSLALPAHQQVFGRHLVDGLAHGALAYPEAGRQLRLAGNHRPWTPLAAFQAAGQQLPDLSIQWAEGWRLFGGETIHGDLKAQRNERLLWYRCLIYDKKAKRRGNRIICKKNAEHCHRTITRPPYRHADCGVISVQSSGSPVHHGVSIDTGRKLLL